MFCGLDPGSASGGIAIIDADSSVVVAEKMPSTERDIAELLERYADDIKLAVIERVHSMPGQGVASSFKFGMSYGGLRMALICCRIPFVAVTPTTWQKEFGLISPGLGQTEKKNRNKARAQELFTGLRITHAMADALMLAEYARRVRA